MKTHFYSMPRFFAATMLISLLAISSFAQKNPNILVIFKDDISYWNLSAANYGMMGFKTPNIARLGADYGFHLEDHWAIVPAFFDWKEDYDTFTLSLGLSIFAKNKISFY